MNLILIVIMALTMANGELLLFDFSSPEKSGDWYTINDDVMGGISQSNIHLNADKTATFTGKVSLENNGGFASIRSRLDINKESIFNGVALRIKGDGNKYNIRFRTHTNFDGYAYSAKIETVEGVWKEYRLPFKDFKPTYRGYTLSNKPPLESADIAQIGVLISDKQSGEFEITIDWIKLYE